MAFDKPPIIIDNGSRYIKAGFACDNHPVSMFRCVVGRPSYLKGRYTVHGRMEYYDVFIGDEAVARGEDYDLCSPVVNGRIEHWDNMERIWHHIFYRELRAAPEDRAVIMAVSPATPMIDKIKCCHVFFEVLNVPAVCVQPSSSLSLYGSGLTTGVTVDIGYDLTEISPVYEGGPIQYAYMNSGFAGVNVTDYIQNCLGKRNIFLGPKASYIIEDMMKHIYVTKNTAIPLKGNKRPFTLPDGTVIDIGQEMFMTGEMFFQPELVVGGPTPYSSLQETIATSLSKCDPDLRSEMYGSVVLTGGLTMIPGLDQRLSQDLEATIKKPVGIIPSPESYVLTWMGAATFAGISEGRKLWVTKKQYEEQGARIVKNKFLT